MTIYNVKVGASNALGHYNTWQPYQAKAFTLIEVKISRNARNYDKYDYPNQPTPFATLW